MSRKRVPAAKRWFQLRHDTRRDWVLAPPSGL
jgi:hypothetical protein